MKENTSGKKPTSSKKYSNVRTVNANVRTVTGNTRTYKTPTGSIGPKSRSQYSDQSSVSKVFGWVKANWSNPIMSQEELNKQKAYYEKEHPGMYPAFKE